uniref:Uncharacterized protein n=1 Tax=Rangifer tarandus platyrhynchus TaxID=3082113 RepID=A0ACB0FHY8_RANTA|nr:unnamed protein product [Rangifer tarandus platyrhynchus]
MERGLSLERGHRGLEQWGGLESQKELGSPQHPLLPGPSCETARNLGHSWDAAPALSLRSPGDLRGAQKPDRHGDGRAQLLPGPLSPQTAPLGGFPSPRRGHSYVRLPPPGPESARPAAPGGAAARQGPTSSSRHGVPAAELAGPRLASPGSRRVPARTRPGLEAARAASRSGRPTSAPGPRSAPAPGSRATRLCLPVPAGLRVRRERRAAAAEGGRERGGRRAGGRGGARGGERGRRRGARGARGARRGCPGGPAPGLGSRVRRAAPGSLRTSARPPEPSAPPPPSPPSPALSPSTPARPPSGSRCSAALGLQAPRGAQACRGHVFPRPRRSRTSRALPGAPTCHVKCPRSAAPGRVPRGPGLVSFRGGPGEPLPRAPRAAAGQDRRRRAPSTS